MRSSILCLVMLLAWSAHADEPDAQARADELIRVGVELRKEGRESDALERFREAHALHPSARALGQMGLAAKSIRLYVEAERYLEGALAASDDPWVQQNREALELARNVVSKQLASLLVRSNVAGAELLVNGNAVAKLPLEQPVRVPAGPALLEVRATGRTPATQQATLPAGTTSELVMELVPEKKHETAKPAPKKAPKPLEREEPASWAPWIFTTLGVGVVGVGIGTYFGVRTVMKKNERDEVCPDAACPDDRGVELDRDARRSALASTISLTIGGAALATSLILFLVEPIANTADARLSPRISF